MNVLPDWWTENWGNEPLQIMDCLRGLEAIPDKAVDLVLADPPYGTGWEINRGRGQGVYLGEHGTAPWDKWDPRWIHQAMRVARKVAVFVPSGRLPEVALKFKDFKLRYYVKSNPRPPMGGEDAPSVEPIVIWPRIGHSKGPAHKVAYNGDVDHPCQKPIEIVEWLIKDLTIEGELVLDPFLGSGTTLLACRRTGRVGCGFEIQTSLSELIRRRSLEGIPDITKIGGVA